MGVPTHRQEWQVVWMAATETFHTEDEAKDRGHKLAQAGMVSEVFRCRITEERIKVAEYNPVKRPA